MATLSNGRNQGEAFGVAAPEPAEDGFDPAIAMARVAQGDIASWDALVGHYGESVSTVTRDFKLSESDAEEVSQRTWLRFLEAFCQQVRPAEVRAWLAATAWEECRRKLGG
jgi:DNA-directed RNA polymerase specialized sigma24 family protein